MKVASEKLAYFRDISRARIPLSMLKNAQHDDFKIILTVEMFTPDLLSNEYVLFYGDDETARDDYSRLLKLFKKLKGK